MIEMQTKNKTYYRNLTAEENKAIENAVEPNSGYITMVVICISGFILIGLTQMGYISVVLGAVILLVEVLAWYAFLMVTFLCRKPPQSESDRLWSVATKNHIVDVNERLDS